MDPGLPVPTTMTITTHSTDLTEGAHALGEHRSLTLAALKSTTRRQALKLAGAAALGTALRLRAQRRVFDARDYGAKGDGVE